MSIDDDARHLLLKLAGYGKHPNDPKRGRYAFEGEELEELMKLTADRLNDAVAVLEGDGYVEVQKFVGTHPYDFGEVSLTAQGRRAAQSVKQVRGDSTPEPARVVADARFSIAEKLGEGTYGEVWRASDHQLKRDVALKFVLAAGEQDALAHARALARVTHPNIVAVHDITAVTHPQSCMVMEAVVMELVRGTPLVELVGPDMRLAEVERVGLAIIAALDAYHSAGLAHLDVHEGNVMVAKDGVKVLDPLYYETAWFGSTATRDKQQARDIRQVRDVLLQMVHGGAVARDAAHVFERATLPPTLPVLREALTSAVAVASEANEHAGPVHAPATVPGARPTPTKDKVRDLRSTYGAWFMAARAWLNTIFALGLGLKETGDPIASEPDEAAEQRERLEAATIQVLFMDGDVARAAKVKELTAVIGMGGQRPRTPDEHRAFGVRCFSVAGKRLAELEDFQTQIAEWLASGEH